MKILIVSDLHMDWDASDAIAAASQKVDFTFCGGDIGLRRNEDPENIVNYIYDTFKSEHTVLTPGNHDFWPVNLLRLYGSGDKGIRVAIDRPACVSYKNEDFNVWFSPWSTQFADWNWMLNYDEEWYFIPEYTDAVITHGPAYGILDECPNGDHAGSQKLLDAILDKDSIKYVFSGHIHGNDYAHVEAHGKHWYNISVLDERYRFKWKLPVFDTKTGTMEYWTEKEWK